MSTMSPMPASPPVPRLSKSALHGRLGIATARTTTADRREYNRRRAEFDLWLIDANSQSVLRCKTDNVSDAGMHVTAPIGFGLAVGQRFEARIATPQPSGVASAPLAASLGYTTVVRTEIAVGDGRPDRVGCAVLFDVPQLLPM
jgi:hypothetical protein